MVEVEKFVVYYESLKGELQKRPIYECRYDERLKTKSEESTRLGYTEKSTVWLIMSVCLLLTRGTGTPKDRDEVNRREVCECDG